MLWAGSAPVNVVPETCIRRSVHRKGYEDLYCIVGDGLSAIREQRLLGFAVIVVECKRTYFKSAKRA